MMTLFFCRLRPISCLWSIFLGLFLLGLAALPAHAYRVSIKVEASEPSTAQATGARELNEASEPAVATLKVPKVNLPQPLAYALSAEIATALALLNSNLEIVTLQDDPSVDAAALASLLRDTPDEAAALLETLGYFSSLTTAKADNDNVTIQVNLGPSLRVKQRDIVLENSQRTPTEDQTLLARLATAWQLQPGAAYTQDGWDDSKKRILAVLLSKEYPLAKITHSAAKLDPETREAYLSLRLDTGMTVRLGEVSVIGSDRYKDSVALGQVDFKTGTVFDRDLLTHLQNNLQNEPHFSRALVTPQFDKINPDTGYVPILITVEEVKRQKIELGLLYATEDGLGARLGYDYYNLFNQSYTGSILAKWQQNEKSLDLGLAMPRLSSGYTHSAALSYNTKDVQQVQTDSVEAGLWRTRNNGNIEARYGLEYILDDSVVGDTLTYQTTALLLSFGWTQRKVDDLSWPSNGYLFDVNLSSTLDELLSSTAFVRLAVRGARYYSAGFFPGTWLVRAEYGQIWAKEASQVPLSRMFTAGGVNSVRGYSFESLGVPSVNGAIVGGTNLATSSLEYQYELSPSWRAAVFSDVGGVSNDWKTIEWASSYGLGARWQSPIAPIAFDVAQATKTKNLAWYLSLGLPF
jgi:translocation and assembly module TamA